MFNFSKKVFDVFGNRLDAIDYDPKLRNSEVIRLDAELVILESMKKHDISIDNGIEILNHKIKDSSIENLSKKNN